MTTVLEQTDRQSHIRLIKDTSLKSTYWYDVPLNEGEVLLNGGSLKLLKDACVPQELYTTIKVGQIDYGRLQLQNIFKNRQVQDVPSVQRGILIALHVQLAQRVTDTLCQSHELSPQSVTPEELVKTATMEEKWIDAVDAFLSQESIGLFGLDKIKDGEESYVDKLHGLIATIRQDIQPFVSQPQRLS